jgi:hypothetical protein
VRSIEWTVLTGTFAPPLRYKRPASRARRAASFSEYWPVAYHSNSLVTIGAIAASAAMIFLPSGPVTLR